MDFLFSGELDASVKDQLQTAELSMLSAEDLQMVNMNSYKTVTDISKIIIEAEVEPERRKKKSKRSKREKAADFSGGFDPKLMAEGNQEFNPEGEKTK